MAKWRVIKAYGHETVLQIDGEHNLIPKMLFKTKVEGRIGLKIFVIKEIDEEFITFQGKERGDYLKQFTIDEFTSGIFQATTSVKNTHWQDKQIEITLGIDSNRRRTTEKRNVVRTIILDGFPPMLILEANDREIRLIPGMKIDHNIGYGFSKTMTIDSIDGKGVKFKEYGFYKLDFFINNQFGVHSYTSMEKKIIGEILVLHEHEKEHGKIALLKEEGDIISFPEIKKINKNKKQEVKKDTELILFPTIKPIKTKKEISKKEPFFYDTWNSNGHLHGNFYGTQRDWNQTIVRIINEISAKINLAIDSGDIKLYEGMNKTHYLSVGKEVYERVFETLEYFNENKMRLGSHEIEITPESCHEDNIIHFSVDGETFCGKLVVNFNGCPAPEREDEEVMEEWEDEYEIASLPDINEDLIDFPIIKPIKSKNIIKN